VLTDIPAGIQEIRAGITTPTAYLKSLKGKTAFSVLDWRDPLPAFGDVWTAIWYVTSSILRKALKTKDKRKEKR
jgi:hypothetical protein